MIVYNKYTNNEDYTWYDSSNIVFSKCYDNSESLKTLKVVFKNGRTYLYKDVNASDYICFKNAQSNGKAINDFIIKKYKGIRISDTDIEKLEKLKNHFINEENEIAKNPISNLIYSIDIDKENNFILKLNDNPIYTGIEGQVSIIRLLKTMNINYSFNNVETLNAESDENKEEITLPDE